MGSRTACQWTSQPRTVLLNRWVLGMGDGNHGWTDGQCKSCQKRGLSDDGIRERRAFGEKGLGLSTEWWIFLYTACV